MKATLIYGIVLCCLSGVGNAHPSHHQQVALINKEIAVHPQRQHLYIERGIAYSSDGRLEQALADLQAAENLGDPVLVAFDLGVLFYRKGQLGTAQRYFDRYLKRFPLHARSLEYRARIHRDAGNYVAAVADFSALFDIQQRPNPGHYISAANMLTQIDGAGIEAAIAILDRGIRQLGLTPQLQREAIALEVQRKDFTKAITRHQALMPIVGKSPEWKAEMGKLLVSANRVDEAREFFHTALQQLTTLRRTPARSALKTQLKNLLGKTGKT